jgi:DNA-binding transcriptional ArsR family regulator
VYTTRPRSRGGLPVRHPARLTSGRPVAKVNHVVYLEELDRTFGALADPTRRGIVAALAARPRTIAGLAEPLPMSLVAVSKHITVLDRAGLLTRTRLGRAQLCTLRPDPLAAAAGWLARYERFWTDRLDSLDRYLSVEDS